MGPRGPSGPSGKAGSDVSGEVENNGFILIMSKS